MGIVEPQSESSYIGIRWKLVISELTESSNPNTTKSDHRINSSFVMESSTQNSTSALLKAVESLENNGLSGIGKVVASSPEYLDAASFSQDSHLVTVTSHVDQEKEAIDFLAKPSQSVNIYIHGESISHLGSVDGTRSMSADFENISIASGDLDVETVETVHSGLQAGSPPLSITALMAPTPDPNFSLDTSTNHCSRGKELWADNKCKEAILEFRKALLGLESILGTNHLLVSKLYYWMGQVYLQMMHTEDSEKKKRALADAAVESLSWSLKIRYTQDDDTSEISETKMEDDENAAVEESLQEAWRAQAQGLPLGTSSPTRRAKNLALLKDSIKIEREADLALFRMDKNHLSQAIDVYVSLVNQYNKAISIYSDDGGFSAMVKMAFWYHKLGRMRALMDNHNDTDSEDELEISFNTVNSAPLDQTEPSKSKQEQARKKQPKSVSLTYLEHAALWYRVALEIFCTGIGRFDKVTQEHDQRESIDVTSHPTYKQLLLRIEQVISDHRKSDKRFNKKDYKGDSYLNSFGVLESVFHQFGAKEAMEHHQKFNIKHIDSLPQLKDLKENLTKAEEQLSASIAIEESNWGRDHQIVLRMRHELSRVSRLKDTLDLEISAFPAKQAMKQKQKEQREKEKREPQGKQQKASTSSTAGVSRTSDKRSRLEPQSKVEELLGSIAPNPFQSKRTSRRRQSPEKRKEQNKKTPMSPMGSKARAGRAPINAMETLRRLQHENYELQTVLKERTAERDALRDQLDSKTGEFVQAMTAAGKKEEEDFESEREGLQRQIKELKQQVNLSQRNQGQLEFDGLDQSTAQKEVELEYWRQKFEAAQTEWTESQTSLEAELRKARTNVGSREADLIEWKGKFDGINSEWRSCQEEVKRLQLENVRLQNEVTSEVAERKQLEFSKKMINLESAQKKDQQILEAMAKVTKSESEVEAWKHKYEVAQKEWLLIQSTGNEKAKEAIADAAMKTTELERWKKKFEIAQREWSTCQTRVEGQARGAIATAKQYEVSHTELTKKFIAAEDSIKTLSEKNKELQKKLNASQSKQDQLEFTLKKQAIDFANMNESLNRKTAEAQIWKEQCQVSQEAQKQISHEIQFSRLNDGSMQERIAELRNENEELQVKNRELQADQEIKKLEIEEKNKEVALVKQAALQRIRQLKDEKKKLKNASVPVRADEGGSNFINYQDPTNPTSLETKLGRAQRALEYVQKDHEESIDEVQALKIAKTEMEGHVAEAQKIISLLRAANSERIEQCSKLENEKDEALRKLRAIAEEKEENDMHRKKSLEPGNGESVLAKQNEDLTLRISSLESDVQRLEGKNDELQSDLKKEKLRAKNWQGQDESMKSQDTEQIKILKDRCEELERDLDNANTDIEEYKKTLSGDETSEKQQDRIKYLLRHCEGLERDIVIANHQIEDLEDELRHYKDQEDDSYNRSQYHDMILAQELERKLEESNNIRKNLSSELETYEGKVERAEAKEKEFKKKLDISNQQIQSLRNSVRDLTKLNLSQHDDGKKDTRNLAIIEDLEEELEESNEIREKLAAELKVCTKKLEKLEEQEKEYQWLSKEYKILEEKLEESNQIREEMETASNSMKRRLSPDDNLSSSLRSEGHQQELIVAKVMNLEDEVEQKVQEIKSLEQERNTMKEALEDLEAENEELTAKYEKLQKQYRGTRRAAEQSTRSLSTMLNNETKEQERVRQKYSKLEDNLEEMSVRNRELEAKLEELNNSPTSESGLEEDLREMSKKNKDLQSRVDEMRKRNIENIKLEKDYEKLSEKNKQLENMINGMRGRSLRKLSEGGTDCQQCLILGEELRSTIEQNDKHILSTEKFQDEHDQLLDRYTLLEKELKEAIEQNEMLESQMTGNENNARDTSLDNDDKYQELNIRCIELEEQLRDSNEINEKKTAQMAAMKTKISDLEAYADETASDLEHAESLLAALKAEGVGGGAEVTLLMGRCNQLQNELKEAQKATERLSKELDNSQRQNHQMKEELDDTMDDLVVHINVEDDASATDKNKAVKELKEDLDRITAEKLELESLLEKATEESEQQKRLKGHVEKDRDYLDRMYNECKSDMAEVQKDLDDTKVLLKQANDDKEELERQLQIEKHVSSSLKTSQNNQDGDDDEESELEELYRQARDELTEVEGMLFETEEELDELKAKYKQLEEESKNDSKTKPEEEEINHNLHDLSHDELLKETQKALRKMQETQLKVLDLQETNTILQAQVKSALTFKERRAQPRQRRRNNNNNSNGGRGGFWSLGNNNNNNNNGDNNNNDNKNDQNGENSNGENPGPGRFGFLRRRRQEASTDDEESTD